MANYWKTKHELQFKWSQVVTGYWQRYPNPNSPHVFSEDILDVQVDDKTGTLKTRRLIMKTNKLPSWGEHLFSTRRVVVVEEAIIDPKAKTMVTYTRNLNLRTFMGTTERATYRPKNDQVTEAFKEVWIESDIYGLRSAIKKFGTDRFKKNCVKATEGFDWVLRRIFPSVTANRKPISSSGTSGTSPEPIVSRSTMSQ